MPWISTKRLLYYFCLLSGNSLWLYFAFHTCDASLSLFVINSYIYVSYPQLYINIVVISSDFAISMVIIYHTKQCICCCWANCYSVWAKADEIVGIAKLANDLANSDCFLALMHTSLSDGSFKMICAQRLVFSG